MIASMWDHRGDQATIVQQFKDAGGLADDDDTCNKNITSLPLSYNNFITA